MRHEDWDDLFLTVKEDDDDDGKDDDDDEDEDLEDGIDAHESMRSMPIRPRYLST